MNSIIFASISFYIATSYAQQAYTACPQYCFPRASGGVSGSTAATTCPSYADYAASTSSYFTATCSCYDYSLSTDGSIWSNCWTCEQAGSSYEATCFPAQPAPVAPANCSSKSDDISTACSVTNDVSTIVSDLCDVDEGLSEKAKGVFAALKLLEPPMARAALSIVDTGCEIWSKFGEPASELIAAGCDIWEAIGGCQAAESDAVTEGSTTVLPSGFASASSASTPASSGSTPASSAGSSTSSGTSSGSSSSGSSSNGSSASSTPTSGASMLATGPVAWSIALSVAGIFVMM